MKALVMGDTLVVSFASGGVKASAPQVHRGVRCTCIRRTADLSLCLPRRDSPSHLCPGRMWVAAVAGYLGARRSVSASAACLLVSGSFLWVAGAELAVLSFLLSHLQTLDLPVERYVAPDADSAPSLAKAYR